MAWTCIVSLFILPFFDDLDHLPIKGALANNLTASKLFFIKTIQGAFRLPCSSFGISLT